LQLIKRRLLINHFNTFAIFNQTLIHPQIAQIIAEKAEEMASNLRKSAKSADKILKTLRTLWKISYFDLDRSGLAIFNSCNHGDHLAEVDIIK